MFIFLANRWRSPRFGVLPLEGAESKPKLGNSISIVTWNVGYGALGERADFLVDGGKHLRVLNAEEIGEATRQIGNELQSIRPEVILLQETAGPSFLTRGNDVRSKISQKLAEYSECFWSDFETLMVPAPLKLSHGMSVYSRRQAVSSEVLELPQDPSFHFGFLKKYYAGIVTRYPISGSDKCWVVVNVHLSAFDDGAAVRKSQIAALFELAEREYNVGNFVVVGGDWNMKISRKEFPHQTDDKYLFWIHDFPQEELPEGWKLVCDDTNPTVRTLHESFVQGVNYTMVIDGFAVSPNVAVNEVRTINLQFQHTDHHPVSANFSTIKSDIGGGAPA